MPIEFDCTQCQLRLRTPDETAGKQAKCPQCGMLVPIPYPGDVRADDPADTRQSHEPSKEPTGSALPGAHPFADPPLVNPYSTPVGVVVTSRDEIKRKIAGPAIGMLAGAIITVPIAAVNLLWLLQTGVDEFAKELAKEAPNAGVEQLQATYVICLVLFGAMAIAPFGVALGAVSMLRMRWYAMALCGTIMALLPCGPCCVISLPFGIWGLIVLNDITVRSAFQ